MPNKSANLAVKAMAVFFKDIRMELRTRSALNAILMFGITTLTVVSYSLGQSNLPPKLLSALFWIIMFFSAMSGLAQGFIREEETGTSLALKITADPDAIYWGKLAFNLSLMSILAVIITPMFFVFTDAPTDNILHFLLFLVLGVIGLCSATTITAAIISKASVKGPLFAVISFPIMIVLLMVLVSGTESVFAGKPLAEINAEIVVLISYSGIMITASALLFKFVWND